MIKNYKVIFVFCLLFFLVSCGRKVFFNKKALREVKEITFIGIILNDNKQENNLKHLVQYPSLTIKSEQFFNHFIATFNTNQYGIKVSFLSELEQKSLLDLEYTPEVEVISNNLVFSYQEEDELFESIENFNKEHYLVMAYASDPWLQKSWGFFKLYDKKKKLIWHEEIRHISTYLIYDKKSPYLIENSAIRVPPNDTNHYQEMSIIYEKLGEMVGDSLLKTLDKAFK